MENKKYMILVVKGTHSVKFSNPYKNDTVEISGTNIKKCWLLYKEYFEKDLYFPLYQLPKYKFPTNSDLLIQKAKKIANEYNINLKTLFILDTVYAHIPFTIIKNNKIFCEVTYAQLIALFMIVGVDFDELIIPNKLVFWNNGINYRGLIKNITFVQNHLQLSVECLGSGPSYVDPLKIKEIKPYFLEQKYFIDKDAICSIKDAFYITAPLLAAFKNNIMIGVEALEKKFRYDVDSRIFKTENSQIIVLPPGADDDLFALLEVYNF
jgi:hypothetical protein